MNRLALLKTQKIDHSASKFVDISIIGDGGKCANTKMSIGADFTGLENW